MLIRRCMYFAKSRKLPAAITITAVAFIFTSCISTGQPKGSYPLMVYDKQLSEIEARLDEIHHRVSVIQLTVDDNARAIKDMGEKTGVYGKEVSALPENIEDQEIQETVDIAIKSEPSEVVSIPSTVIKEDAESLLPLSGSVKTIYDTALAAYKGGDYDRAVTMFRSVVSNYPGHDLADNALYWEGECFYSQKQFQQAISTFKKVMSRYPQGSKVPDSLLKAGYSYLSINDYDNGRILLKKVIKSYPFSTAGAKAEKMLSRIKKK